MDIINMSKARDGNKLQAGDHFINAQQSPIIWHHNQIIYVPVFVKKKLQLNLFAHKECGHPTLILTLPTFCVANVITSLVLSLNQLLIRTFVSLK